MTTQDPASGGCASSPPALGPPDEVLDTACRLLLRTGAPVSVDELVRELPGGLGDDLAAVERTIAGHESRGRMSRAGQLIVASAGVSVVPSYYEVDIGARRLWAWCAHTALGVVSALGMGGSIVSRSPHSGVELRTRFTGAQPVGTGMMVFWPSEGFRNSCGSAAGEYCLTFNIFEDAPAARAWAQASGVPGEVLTVQQATERAVVRWRQSLDVGGQGDQLVAALAHPRPAPVPSHQTGG